jgi:hypothetical protein
MAVMKDVDLVQLLAQLLVMKDGAGAGAFLFFPG